MPEPGVLAGVDEVGSKLASLVDAELGGGEEVLAREEWGYKV